MWEEFSVIALTAALNNQLFVPGQVGATMVFGEEGVATTTIKIEENEGTLAIIEPSARGGPGQTSDDDDRRLIPFEINHFEINDVGLGRKLPVAAVGASRSKACGAI
jgi:hypothetical protein